MNAADSRRNRSSLLADGGGSDLLTREIAMIELFTANTPNGIKIPLALEELGLEYDLRMFALRPEHLQSAEFLAINPNAKIPALRANAGSADEVTVFESGAILLFIADTFGGLIGRTPAARAQTLSWLFLQVAGLGPAMGNAGHFASREGPESYGYQRFNSEAKRLMQVLEERLAECEWLDGDGYSIADIAHFSWARNAPYAGIDLAEFPAVSGWILRIEGRPASKLALLRMASNQ